MTRRGWVFSMTDPNGRTVRCGHDAWRHIIRDHSDLATERDAILDVICHPDEIYADADNPDRECYYRFNISLHGITCSLKVVVQFGPLSRFLGGVVVTAFEKYDVSPSKIKRGERKLWP